MRRRDQRLLILGAAAIVLVGAGALTMAGLSSSVVYFYAPSELAERATPGQSIRLGGLVREGSVVRDADGATRFVVTDGGAEAEVRYEGVLPDLFREGQGVVAEGIYTPDAIFEASRVLAKHDETYMPREVAEALKQRGEWKGSAN
ncbi:MAG: cytochrome c maturation protein CcmE [Hyphomonadaceae bacterium]